MDEWAGLISEREMDIYAVAGFGHRVGLGSRPALLIIDVQYRTLGRERMETLDAATTQYPTACGLPGWEAVDRLVPVLSAARAAGVPVIYPHVAPKDRTTVGRLGDKNVLIADIEQGGYEFVDEVRPAPEDILVPKDHPSAFFGTAMLSHLVARGVDTLLIAGATTSGCVRATVVDAFSMNFRVAVIRDAVFDRGETSHRVNLFDIWSKYADLLHASEVVDYLQRIEDGGTT